MKKIREQLESIRASQKELAELERMEAKLTADLLSIATDNISSASVRQKVADASLTKQVIGNRRAALDVPRAAHFQELNRLTRAGVAQWNEAVAAAADKQEESIIRASLAWFDDRADCLAFWRQGNMQRIPTLNRIRNLHFETAFLPKVSSRDHFAFAESFMAHVERHAASIKFDPATIN